MDEVLDQIPEALEQIPPEAWPIIDLMFNITMAATGIWLAVTVFVMWRRNASNLTPVNAADKNRKVDPDFLSVDEKGRAEALKRGDQFEKELTRRERDEARAVKSDSGPMTFGKRMAQMAALFMSLFTLATMILGSIWQVSRMGDMMSSYSTPERLMAVISNHPIAFTIATLVIVYHIYRFFTDRKWQPKA